MKKFKWFFLLTLILMLSVNVVQGQNKKVKRGTKAQTRVDFTLTMSDGTILDCTKFIPTGSPPSGGRPALILCHGYGGSKEDVMQDAEDYASEGYFTLCYSMRGPGNSGEEAFREMVDMYRTRVASIAYGLVGNFEDARDISQEVFVKVYRALNRFDTNKKFFTWLYRLAVNASIDFLRANRKRSHQESIDSEQNFAQYADQRLESDLEFYLENMERREIFQQIVDELNPRQKMAFVLCDLQGLSSIEAFQKSLIVRKLRFAGTSTKHARKFAVQFKPVSPNIMLRAKNSAERTI